MIRGIIFDFDGLIIDTEFCYFRAVQELYQEFNCQVPQIFYHSIGSSHMFNPIDYLKLQGFQFDRKVLCNKLQYRHFELSTSQPILPGVLDYIKTSKSMGLKLGLASSSSRSWVISHLTRLGLLNFFDCIKCADDIKITKPDPEVYTTTLEELRIEGRETLALEDSSNGIIAAKSVGIFSVAVPSNLTRQLDFAQADLVLNSLAEISLEELLIMANKASNL